MKCPKCGYLGFEDVDRCRNCGYDFSFAGSAAAVPELPLRAAADSPEPIAELPLFGPPIPDDDQPLITRASPPRAPLSVRRATPEVPRVRTEPRVQTLDLSLDPEPAVTAPVTPGARAFLGRQTVEPIAVGHDNASVGARLLAVTIDLLILAVVDVLVVYLTMQICGLSVDDLSILPKGPLLAFLLLQNGGYLVTFTAGGQTLGKMAAGIRVVPTEADAVLDVGRALLRTLMWLVLAVPAGLGFLTAVFSRDHRGLHDRFAGTRVVR